MTPTTQARDVSVTLADILATESLRGRRARQPDHPAEIAALHELAQRLVDHPDSMLDTLMDVAMRLCRADTAGLSVLARDESGAPIFRWVALGGSLAAHVGGSTPRGFSPCGVCLDAGAPQLFRYPERYFVYFQAARPAIVEGLVIPVKWKGEALGTIWIVSHDGRREFDGEDARVMESLASFTAAALSVQSLRREAEAHRSQLEQRVAERTVELTDSRDRLRSALDQCAVLEQARSEWLRAMIAAQEDERRRVARELHDEMGQHLTALTMGLRSIDGPSERQRGDATASLHAIVDKMDRGVCRLSRALRPAELDDLGLVSALGALTSEWAVSTGIGCEFSSRHCERRLTTPVETTVYRIAQEALTNVARHSRATHASVIIDHRDDRLLLVVDDDGRGFDESMPEAAEPSRFGLIGIRERAALLDGDVRIETSSTGTALFVTIPTKPEQPAVGAVIVDT